ncbi:MAG: hypothetical protein WD794_12205 [Mycobacteriales bacterium]
MRELTPAVRLGVFGVGLVAVLVGALALGRATGDVADAAPLEAGAHAAHGGDRPGPDVGAGPLGTTLSAGGLRLDVPTTTLPARQTRPFTFRVLGDGGRPVTAYDVEQGKQMHLVLVSRDLARHAHVHPELAADGTWSVPLILAAGSYRAVADFSTGGERRSLAVDLAVPGPLEARPLPAPEPTATVGDLRVALSRDGSELSFTASRTDGTPVVPQPYLGARGHLVAFRAGDLAYTHVHPAREEGATTTYAAQLPGPGSYRLFLELRVDDVVRTVPFTLESSA